MNSRTIYGKDYIVGLKARLERLEARLAALCGIPLTRDQLETVFNLVHSKRMLEDELNSP